MLTYWKRAICLLLGLLRLTLIVCAPAKLQESCAYRFFEPNECQRGPEQWVNFVGLIFCHVVAGSRGFGTPISTQTSRPAKRLAINAAMGVCGGQFGIISELRVARPMSA